MHLLIIGSNLLNRILETIFLTRPTKFVFHLLLNTDRAQSDCNLLFQANYNDSFYTSYTINTELLVFFDSIEFENNKLVLNYEQCEKLIELTRLFKDSNVSFGFNEDKGTIETVVSHNNVKLEFSIDHQIDHNQIIPPDTQLYNIVDYIPIQTKLFLNIVTLVNNNEYYTQMEVEPSRNRLILGDNESFKTTLKLSNELILEPAIIIINPDSIILFLNKIDVQMINIKIHESLAFVINFETEFGSVFYYRAHETV
jgi:hypothetical protein